MRRQITTALAAGILTFAGAAGVAAQEHGHGRGHDKQELRERRERDDVNERNRSVTDVVLGRRGDQRDDDRYEDDRDEGRRGNGPPFCRNGKGHPTKGWRWCQEKGWDRNGTRWDQVGWGDVIFRNPRDSRTGRLDQRTLGDVLGDIILGRLDARRSYLGVHSGFSGYWQPDGRGRTLNVTAGGVPIARLVDRDGDGRADTVYLAGH